MSGIQLRERLAYFYGKTGHGARQSTGRGGVQRLGYFKRNWAPRLEADVEGDIELCTETSDVRAPKMQEWRSGRRNTDNAKRSKKRSVTVWRSRVPRPPVAELRSGVRHLDKAPAPLRPTATTKTGLAMAPQRRRKRGATRRQSRSSLAVSGPQAPVAASPTQTLQSVVLHSHGRPARCVAFSPDGSLLASGAENMCIRLFSMIQRGVLRILEHNAHVEALAFSPDGDALVSASTDGTICQWDVKSGRRRGEPLTGHQKWVRNVAYSPDGNIIASSSGDRTIRLWDPRTGDCLEVLEGHTSDVGGISFAPDGLTLASASHDGTIRFWDLTTSLQKGEPLRGPKSVLIQAVSFSPDGLTLASGGGDRIIRMWDSASGTQQYAVGGGTGTVLCVTFSKDGRFLASAHGTPHNVVRLWRVGSEGPPKEIATMKEHKDRVWSVAFSPDGQYLASGAADKSIRLWSLARLI